MTTNLTQTAPERIFLNVSDDRESENQPFPKNPHGDEITWSADQALPVSVVYVRADLHKTSPDLIPEAGAATRHAAKCRSYAAKLFNELPPDVSLTEAGDRLLYAAQLLDLLAGGINAMKAAELRFLSGQQWQPIETAPKDGTTLLLWERYEDEPFIGLWATRANGGRWIASTTHYDTDGNACVIDRVCSQGVTHWMPLPAAPTPSTKGETHD